MYIFVASLSLDNFFCPVVDHSFCVSHKMFLNARHYVFCGVEFRVYLLLKKTGLCSGTQLHFLMISLILLGLLFKSSGGSKETFIPGLILHSYWVLLLWDPPECPLFIEISLLQLLGMQRCPSPAWALGTVQLIALSHSLPGLMEFHLSTYDLTFSKICGRPHADFQSFLLCCTLPCKFQLRPGNPLCLLGFLIAVPPCGKGLQAHFLYFHSLRVQNPALPVPQCLKTSVSYILSSLLLDCGGRAGPVSLTPFQQP